MKTRVVILLTLHCVLSYTNGKDVSYTGFTPLHSIDDKVVFNHHMYKRQQQPINTTSTVDHHDYYTSRFIEPGNEANGLWFELDSLVGSGATSVDEDASETVIQGSHRAYELWDLMFPFPFYGHIVNRVAVTTGGFLYTGSSFNSQVHLTQFIAPLQADFNPSINDTARILVYSTVDRFTVQWEDVHNHDHIDAGPFTFQVTLFPNGVIHFIYRKIPLLVTDINNDDHPVEVGLADAFYYDVFQSIFRIRYTFEYSRIKLNASNDLSYSAYIISPLPNCVQANNCTRCIELSSISSFECTWCSSINRCSDGFDRNSQEWIDNQCIAEGVSSCENKQIVSDSTISPTSTSLPRITPTVGRASLSLSEPAIAGFTIMLLLIVIAMIIISIVILVLVYGYKHPNTTLGLYMIKYRPSARSLNKSARYNIKTDKILLE